MPQLMKKKLAPKFGELSLNTILFRISHSSYEQ